jgi:hypothetical protein
MARSPEPLSGMLVPRMPIGKHPDSKPARTRQINILMRAFRGMNKDPIRELVHASCTTQLASAIVPIVEEFYRDPLNLAFKPCKSEA